MKSNKKHGLNFLGSVCLSFLALPVLLLPFSWQYNQTYLQNVEKRKAKRVPKVESLANLIDNDFYEKVDTFLADQIAFRGSIIQAKRWIDIEILGENRIDTVDIGRQVGQNQWLFFTESYWRPNVQTEEAAYEVTQVLEKFLDEPRHRAEFRLVVAPDKHTIYAEYLNRRGRYDVQKTSNARQIFHTWFKQKNDKRVIDLWSILLEEKKKTKELLYEPTDTHHTYVGAMIMLREIVESIDPNLWQEQDIVVVGQKTIYDLSSRIGARNLDKPTDILEVQRPGVKIERIFLNKRELNQPQNPQKIISDAHWKELVRVVVSSEEQPLIKGKTLVIHDSFIHTFLRSSMTQFFEDVSFIHHSQVTPKMLRTALNRYDYVILETVERHAFGNELAQDNLNVLNRLLAQP